MISHFLILYILAPLPRCVKYLSILEILKINLNFFFIPFTPLVFSKRNKKSGLSNEIQVSFSMQEKNAPNAPFAPEIIIIPIAKFLWKTDGACQHSLPTREAKFCTGQIP